MERRNDIPMSELDKVKIVAETAENEYQDEKYTLPKIRAVFLAALLVCLLLLVQVAYPVYDFVPNH